MELILIEEFDVVVGVGVGSRVLQIMQLIDSIPGNLLNITITVAVINEYLAT